MAGSSSGLPWLIVGGAMFGAAMLMVPFLFLAAAFVGAGGAGGVVDASGCSSSIGTADEIEKIVKKELAQGKEPPPVLIPVYNAASAKYKLGPKGPSILASINKIETGFGTNRGFSSAGAQGWMQFMPPTWDAYGVDADKDGKKDIHDPDDAIFAAANYLSASGAPEDWYKAIFAYNRADWYVDDVLSGAQKFDLPPAEGCPT